MSILCSIKPIKTGGVSINADLLLELRERVMEDRLIMNSIHGQVSNVIERKVMAGPSSGPLLAAA